MTSGWAIVYGATTVNLPVAPKMIDESYPTKIDKVNVDGGGTVLVSRFIQERQLKLQGSIYVAGASNATLESTYLSVIRGFLRQKITITDPDSQWSGNWLFEKVDFHREQEGGQIRYVYTMTFLQGVSIVSI